MGKVSLKVVIAGRTYPLTIKQEEEEAIKNAADRINTNIKKLQGSYAVKDMQDLLAMTTLQMAVQSNSGVPPTTKSSDESVEFDADLKSIIDKIDAAL